MTGKGISYRTRTIHGFFTQLYIFVLEISAPAIDLGGIVTFLTLVFISISISIEEYVWVAYVEES